MNETYLCVGGPFDGQLWAEKRGSNVLYLQVRPDFGEHRLDQLPSDPSNWFGVRYILRNGAWQYDANWASDGAPIEGTARGHHITLPKPDHPYPSHNRRTPALS